MYFAKYQRRSILYLSSIFFSGGILCTFVEIGLAWSIIWSSRKAVSVTVNTHTRKEKHIAIFRRAGTVWSESFECLKEDQAFSSLYDLAPHPHPPSPLLFASCLPFSVFLCIAACRAYWQEWGGGGGGGARSFDGEKAWSAINHSILFGFDLLKYGGPNLVWQIENVQNEFK